jgi:predicted helicase
LLEVIGSPSALNVRMSYFKKQFEKAVAAGKPNEKSIKWSRNLKRKLGPTSTKRDKLFDEVLFRPFVTKKIWLSKVFVDELGAMMSSFQGENRVLAFLCVSSANPLSAYMSPAPVDYGLLKAGNGGTQCLFRYRYAKDGERMDNITDWALNKFQRAYGKFGNLRPDRSADSKDSPAAKNPPRNLTKDDIFNYVYAVMHDPVYKVEYAANLRKSFPRIPFKEDFWRWADWGSELSRLHLGFISADPWPIKRADHPPKPTLKRASAPKPILRSEPRLGRVLIDSNTSLEDIPPTAWAYKLGNRSAIDWVLDQFKEKKSRDPVIVQHKLNTYQFADYKEHVIDLLGRVVGVSIGTAAIEEEMGEAGTGP